MRTNHPDEGSKLPGSAERFVELLEPIKRGLLLYCRTLAGDRDSAKDLASEAIAIAYESFATLREESALKAYLYTTVKRLAVRERVREERHSGLDAAEQHQTGDAPPDVLADLRLLQEALMLLPEAQREAVVWKDLSGLQLEDIRELQGGSLSAVKMRLIRGREELARLLGERSKKNRRPSTPSPLVTVTSSSL